MNMMRKRLISLNLAILMLLSLVLPAGAAELYGYINAGMWTGGTGRGAG